jgi:6-phosphogluconolactonase
MELVHAQVAELKGLLTQSFEEWAAGPLRQGSGAAELSLSCALSGGNTALIFLPALRDAQVDWSRITLFWADERAVDPDDPESNYGLAERMLLTPLGARAPQAIRMPTELPLGDAALQYDDALARELDAGPLDLAILGVGEDGHICSLFPGHQALLENSLRAVAVEDAPKLPRRRLSLSMRFVLQTRKIWVIALGPRKLGVLHAALSRKQRSTPLDVLIQDAKEVTVFTDQVIRSAALHSRPYG